MLEIIAETVSDAVAAQAGGATQLDLKCALSDSGLTASAGMIEQVCTSVNIDTLVMIRPHARGFAYTADDVAVMVADIRLGCRLGAAGFLLGCLTEDRRIDANALRVLQEAAGDRPLHFHLAWELTDDPAQALETLIELGISSVRITGCRSLSGKAIDGVLEVRRFAQQAGARIEFFLAGGVRALNVGRLVAGTGVVNAHAGSGVRVPPTAHGAVTKLRVQELAQALQRAVALLHSA